MKLKDTCSLEGKLWQTCACMLSCFSHVRLFVTLWTLACQAPLSMEISRQDSGSGLPCPPPGDLPDPGIEHASPMSPALQVDSSPTEPPGKPIANLDSVSKSRDITLITKVHIVKAKFFWVVVYGCEFEPKRRLSAEEMMLLNCGTGEDSWESLGQQGEPTSQL